MVRIPGFVHTRGGKILIAALLLLIVFIVVVAVSVAYTERSSFCSNACHEMNPYGATWRVSQHSDIDCIRCHIKPGAIEFIEAKLSAVREVYVHISGKIKKPIAVTEHIPDATCAAKGCHPLSSIKDPLTWDAMSFSHKQHAGHEILCIDCHSQVVHRSVPGRPFLDPKTMAFCLRCHDGKKAPSGCETCHRAPHVARGRCTDCHQLASWKSTFKHPVTLAKPHQALACEKCHTMATATAMGFPDGCVACHADRHKNNTTLCAKCHRTTAWRPSTFKHPGTGCTDCHKRPHADRGPCLRCHTTSSWANHFAHPIPLGGVHASFPCERCHVNGLSAPGKGCSSCHGSQHGGLTNCASCHTTSSWIPSTFHHPAAGDHSASSFACSACHPNGFASYNCTCHGGSPPGGGG
jgi:nitrate/TMAO reductase-like tetraheme cytochrome c subunit